jgi:hypothetical protein
MEIKLDPIKIQNLEKINLPQKILKSAIPAIEQIQSAQQYTSTKSIPLNTSTIEKAVQNTINDPVSSKFPSFKSTLSNSISKSNEVFESLMALTAQFIAVGYLL